MGTASYSRSWTVQENYVKFKVSGSYDFYVQIENKYTDTEYEGWGDDGRVSVVDMEWKKLETEVVLKRQSGQNTLLTKAAGDFSESVSVDASYMLGHPTADGTYTGYISVYCNGTFLNNVAFSAVCHIDSVHYYRYLYYDANGGSGAPSTQSYSGTDSSNSFTISSTKPTREGYDFLGWSTSSSASTASYQPGGSVSASGTNDVTLYAVWSPKYTVIAYDANEGSGAPASESTFSTSDVTYTISTTKPTRSGYTFWGWSATQQSSTTDSMAEYAPGDTVTVTKYTTLTLYAVWRSKAIVTVWEGGYVDSSGAIQNEGGSTSKVYVPIATATALDTSGYIRGYWTGSAIVTSVTLSEDISVLARHDIDVETKAWTGASGEHFTYSDMNRVETAANALALELGTDRVSFIETTRASQFRYDEAQKLETLLKTVGAGRYVGKTLSIEESWGYNRTVSYTDFNRWEELIKTIYDAIGGDV